MVLTRNNNCYANVSGPPTPITRRTDMAVKTPVCRRLIAGVGGASLMLAIFLPWAGVEGINRTGWELNTVAAVLFLIAGVFGIATAITGGQYGAGRPDLSVIAATDLLNTTAMLLLAWLIPFDFPEHATRRARRLRRADLSSCNRLRRHRLPPSAGERPGFHPSKPANQPARVSSNSSISRTLCTLGALRHS